MLETYADRPLTTQLAVKRGFVHFEIGASADLKMDKAEVRGSLFHGRKSLPRRFIRNSSLRFMQQSLADV